MKKDGYSYTKTRFKKESARLMEKIFSPANLAQEESVKILRGEVNS